jgi:eukaryotic-like serine/threonine-protein kinase
MRLGRYEIVSPLGAGGMGEVYRARDIELDRIVAVKVLPSHIANHSESRLRFEREARAISALNHPHICTLHDVGREGEIAYFVMELVDGESLAARLSRGKVPIEQALVMGAQIAAALSAAHRRGIVHRDLKPANVMLTRTGVKLLDFGIARLGASPGPHSYDTAAPTIAGDMTAQGTIMGTLQYMAPEQLEGLPADERADIFAMGCILYELISGQRAFAGTSQASIITAIMSSEPPPLPTIEPIAPAPLERLVRKCLAKSRDDRWQNAADLETALCWLEEDGPEATSRANTPATRALSRRWLWPAIALGAFALVMTALALSWRSTTAPPPPARLSIPLFSALPDTSLLSQQMSLSPDGRHLVFIASQDGKSSLWLRPLNGDKPVALPDTTGATSPFWSPDSSSIAFFSTGKLLRVAREGGDVQTICSVSPGAIKHGAWGHDGTIVFDEISGRPGLFRVPAAGGEAVLIPGTETGTERRPAWPAFVGNSNRVLYCLVSTSSEKFLHIVSLDGKEPPKNLGPVSSRVQIVGDQMLFVRDGTLYTQRFDSSFQRIGEPARIASYVGYYGSLGTAAFSASPHSIAYFSSLLDARLTSFDRSGKASDISGIERVTGVLRLSLDGRKAAVSSQDPRSGTTDIWVADLTRGGAVRVTSWPGSEGSAVLSPDGRSIAFSSDRDGPPHLFIQSLASSSPEAITPLRGIQALRDWTSDGSLLMFDETNATTRRDIWITEAKPSSTPKIWLQTPSQEQEGRISNDGKWVAFTSSASGRDEIYVAPFDRPSESIQVSLSGGRRAAWKRDGSELYYMTRDGGVYRVPIRTTPAFEAGTPELLFRSVEGTWEGFDATADGDRFLVVREISGPRNRPIDVVTNWQSLLPKR